MIPKKSLMALMLLSMGPLYASSKRTTDEERTNVHVAPIVIKATDADSFFDILIPNLKKATDSIERTIQYACAASNGDVCDNTRKTLDKSYKGELNRFCKISFESVWQNTALFKADDPFQSYDIFFDRINTTLRMEVPSLNLAKLGLQESHLSTQKAAMMAVGQLQAAFLHLAVCKKRLSQSQKTFRLISLDEEKVALKKLNKLIRQTERRIEHLTKEKAEKNK